jgi:membrane-associated phospholipid phosphatase
VLIGAGELVVRTSTVTAADRRVTTAVFAHRGELLVSVMKLVTWCGSWIALVVTGVLLGLLVLLRRLHPAFLVLAAVAWAGEAGGTTLAKHVVRRDRPPEHFWAVDVHGWSWPSGHTAVAVIVFAVLAATVVSVLAPSPGLRVLTCVVAGLLIIAVACSRVVLGVHWTSDVLASLVFVSLWLTAVGVLFREVLTLALQPPEQGGTTVFAWPSATNGCARVG